MSGYGGYRVVISRYVPRGRVFLGDSFEGRYAVVRDERELTGEWPWYQRLYRWWLRRIGRFTRAVSVSASSGKAE